MAEKESTTSAPTIIPISQSDMLHGINGESMIQQANAKMQAMIEAQQAYVTHLRRAYNAPDNYELKNWAKGFTLVSANE